MDELGKKDAINFTATFEVKQGSDKMIVVVINEPESLSAQLDAIPKLTKPGFKQEMMREITLDIYYL